MAEPAQDHTFQITGLTGLSQNAARFLKRHPSQAQLAVKIALETAASQHVDETGPDDIPPALEPFLVIKPRGDDMIGVSEAAARLNVSRTTVYDWATKGLLLAWRTTKRGLTIPAEQIRGEGDVVAGLDQVADMIGDPELAWIFLTTEMPFADRAAQPIDMLKAGRIDDVLGAAAGFGTDPT